MTCSGPWTISPATRCGRSTSIRTRRPSATATRVTRGCTTRWSYASGSGAAPVGSHTTAVARPSRSDAAGFASHTSPPDIGATLPPRAGDRSRTQCRSRGAVHMDAREVRPGGQVAARPRSRRRALARRRFGPTPDRPVRHRAGQDARLRSARSTIATGRPRRVRPLRRRRDLLLADRAWATLTASAGKRRAGPRRLPVRRPGGRSRAPSAGTAGSATEPARDATARLAGRRGVTTDRRYRRRVATGRNSA